MDCRFTTRVALALVFLVASARGAEVPSPSDDMAEEAGRNGSAII